LGSLTNKQIARFERHAGGLLLRALDGDKPHGWPRRRFGDRLGVGRVVLVSLHEGLHVDRCNQPHLMAQRADLAPRCELAQASIATKHFGTEAKNDSTFARDIFLRNEVDPSARAPCAWKTFFAKSSPMMLSAVALAFG
jgi:hypothetical protein